MNAFQIKLVAIVTMVIDHIGAYLFPDVIYLRLIGRVSFPLFSFLIANGANYTSNINKYISRMIAFAFISQIPFYLVNKMVGRSDSLNILFTFSLALIAITILSSLENYIHKVIIIFTTALIADFFKVDYGAFGILLTLSFFLFFNNTKAKVLAFILLVVSISFTPAINSNYINFSNIDFGPLISLFSLIFILSYNHQEGRKAKYLFYVFYPFQFLVIYLVRSFTL